jgi:RNA polymerase sigma-70 factor (ECF subfamily)
MLVHRYDRHVFSLAANFVNNAEDAKDIYQEVFYRVYRALPKFELRSEFSTWLYRITTNVCLTHRTRRRKHTHRSYLEGGDENEDVSHAAVPVADRQDQPDRKALDAEISGRIDEALQGLSPRMRMVFTLRHFDGYRIQEIAAMLGCSEGAVKKYLFQATRRMRSALKDIQGE